MTNTGSTALSRRPLTVTLLAMAFLLVITGSALTVSARSAPLASEQSDAGWQFDQSEDVNQWWLQVRVTPPAGESVTTVEAIVDGATWHTLTLQSYGDWTANVDVGTDPSIVYRAWDATGQSHDSEPFTLSGSGATPPPATTASPSATAASPSATAASPSATAASPSATAASPSATSSASAGAPAADFDTVTSGSEYLLTGDYASGVWVSDQFQGSWTRSVAGDHDRYLVELNETAGGFDTDIVRNNAPLQRVDELSAGLTVSATTDVRLTTQGDGMWWAGPKFTVHDETSFQGFEGDYENYIVENASLSPEALAERMFGGNAQYLGETQVDGAVYKHYLSQHSGGWEQYWAIRQSYRTSGTVSATSHLQTWRNNGMANEYVLIQKPANIETYGAVSGEVEMSDPTYVP